MTWDPAFARVLTMMTLSVSMNVLVVGIFTSPIGRVTPLEPVTVSICDGALAACAGEPFPEIRNWESLTIRLSRGACFGMCPSYLVTVRGDGNVVVVAGDNTARPGVHRLRISKEDVRALFEKFRAASFFALKDEYRADVTDLPTYTVMLEYDGHRKWVTDYAGHIAGMPLVVTELEYAIDETGQTSRWITATAQ